MFMEWRIRVGNIKTRLLSPASVIHFYPTTLFPLLKTYDNKYHSRPGLGCRVRDSIRRVANAALVDERKNSTPFVKYPHLFSLMAAISRSHIKS